MRNRYLLGAGVAPAAPFGCAQAHAQFFGGPYPGVIYVGPEGGWTSLSDQSDKITTVPFTVAGSGVISGVSATAKYSSGYNVGGRLGYLWGPWRFEEEYSYRSNGLSNFLGF